MTRVNYIYERLDFFCVEYGGLYYKVPSNKVLITYRNDIPDSYSVHTDYLVNGTSELSYDA